MPSENITTKPAFRKLRAYAFDPSLSVQLDTVMLNNVVYKVAWETLSPGPVGDYIEIVDWDPSSKCFYKPVNLDDPVFLAQEGLAPSESNPLFHQQMVYAVAMTTIKNFEKALGRAISWSPRRKANGFAVDYVHRLRIYPHALREANAYYSPIKKSVLFGYFSAAPESPGLLMPGGTVYTCLSHDIIAHEITHALLDGMHRRYVEATHLDSLAFHEAFADIVALFQHFTFQDVLYEQIARTRGNLASQSLLGELAQQFGKAIGHYGSLRDALGGYDKNNKWQPRQANTKDYQTITEPHERGSILVSTIFDLFINIYSRRVADLSRIASGGTGILPEGSLHPDLVTRMAHEASKTAAHVLNMCVRALDYCPPMDINYGDYLRAMVTADYDLVEDDDKDYRIALIESFQKRGIYPDNIRNMSVESLLCKTEEDTEQFEDKFSDLIEFFKLFKEKVSYIPDREELFWLTQVFIAGGDINNPVPKLQRKNDKPPKPVEDVIGLHQRLLHLSQKGKEHATAFGELTGLILDTEMADQLGIGRSNVSYAKGLPSVEVHNLKLASRVGPDGNVVNQILVTITQRRGVVGEMDEYGNVHIKGFFVPANPRGGWYERIKTNGKEELVKRVYENKDTGSEGPGSEKVLPEGWFIFRGGSTLIFDLNYAFSKDNVKLKYVIRKSITDELRMKRQFRMMFGVPDHSLNATYFGPAKTNLEAEPFAIIHKAL